jgi:hypothetical protein
MRRRLLITTLVALTLTTPAAAQAAEALYPDLKTLQPRNLQFEDADVSQDSSGVVHGVLRFSNTVVNEGQGPVEIRASINQRLNPPSGPAFQRIYGDDGTPRDIQLGASTLYYHAVHVHYHFDHWGEYQLWTKRAYDDWIASGRRDGEPDLVGQKTTSCVMDEEFVKPTPSAVWPDRYPSDTCMPNRDGVIAQGLSSGWGDTYDYFRFEQWIDLGPRGTRLADGTYVLRSVTDPLNLVYESPDKADVARENQLDNEAIRTFVVSGGRILDSDAPDGTATLNHIDEVTNSPQVRLDVLGRDDVSGVTQFRVSNDGGTTWNTFNNTSEDSRFQNLTWDLTDASAGGTRAPGLKTVCVMFKDASGKWGPVQTDTIDYQPPGQVTSAYGRAVQSDNPVSWWRLGETSGTAAANQAAGDTGTYTGTRTLGQTSLLRTDSNPSVAFSGSGSVAVADSAVIDLRSAFTLEAWIKPSRLPSTGTYASVMTKPEAYSLQFNGSVLEFTIMQNGTRKRLRAPSGLTVGQTYHVVGTYDGTTQRLYINGAQVSSVALSGSATVNSDGLRIASWNGSGENFSGTVDEPAIYASTLSAARVRAHYDAASTASATLDAPTALTGRPRSSTTIDLSWNDNASGDTGQVIQRSTDAAFSAPTAIDVGASATSYADSGLTARTTYWYRVRTVNASTSSNWSNTIAVTTHAPASYAGAIDSDTPVSYWRLGEIDGTIAGDDTVVGPGTFVGSPLLGAPSLVFSAPGNPAIGFDGVGSHIRIGQTGSYDLTSAISLEAWIKPTSLPSAGTTRTILAKTGSYALQLDGPAVAFAIVQGGVRKLVQAPAGAIAPGVTAHVVGTFDGTTQRLYVNGTLVASTPLAGAADLSFGGVRIGTWDGSSEYFAGTIDDASIWSKVLSPTQVGTHFAAGQLPLGAPIEPSAAAVSSAQVDLSWTDTANEETAIVLQRSTDAAFSAPTSITLAANSRSHADTRLSAATDYWYRVRAITASESSPWSDVVTARTAAAPPVVAYADVVAADTPVSWWRLGESGSTTTAADQQGVNAGTYTAGVTRGSASLLASDAVNTAATFNGTSSTVRIAHSSSLNLTTAITLEAWIKPTRIPSSGTFASVLTKPEAYSLQFNGSRIEFTVMQNGMRRRVQSPTGAVVTNSTYHVVGTYDGVTQRLYLNGAQVASAALTGRATTNSNALQIGSWDGGAERYRGIADEVAVYGRTLDASAVLQHYTAGTRRGV